MKKDRKIILLFSIILLIFTIGIVPKQFQNDTFFNISVGKYILNNGIDMQEHFSWIHGLKYGYSHWAFDILMYLLYYLGNFTSIYIFILFFSFLINLTLFLLLYKKNKSPIIAFIVTLISSYIIKDCFTARSQIISFICFIIEIYCIEQFIDTNKNKYAIILIFLSIIVANFHAATWPLFLILFMPYIACEILNFFTLENFYSYLCNKTKKKLNKLDINSKQYKKNKEKLEKYEIFLSSDHTKIFSKVVRKSNYNFKNLIILLIILMFTGLITPIKDTPYTYIIHSMFGESNMENSKSIDYIQEMQPIILASNLGIIVFSIIFIAFLAFTPSKLKSEHGLLVLGLYIMTISSNRYIYLLVFIGSYVICDLIVNTVNILCPEDIKSLEKIITNKWIASFLIFLAIIFTSNKLLNNFKTQYVNEKLYPIEATQYIKQNLDYKNIRIYNHYIDGSYLMLNDIPVFIDSRLDVYCSEFNNTEIFKDYINTIYGNQHYDELFKKYDFTHYLINKSELIYYYISKDSNYKSIYEDDYFIIYEKIN